MATVSVARHTSAPGSAASAASHLVATVLFLFIVRDGRWHLPADRASLGERVLGDNSPSTEGMEACAHRGPLSRLFVCQAKIEPALFNKRHLICRIPDIYSAAADIAHGLLGETGASIGSLAQKRNLANGVAAKVITHGRPVQLVTIQARRMSATALSRQRSAQKLRK